MNKHSFIFLYSCLIFANSDIYVNVSNDTIFVGDKIQVNFIVQNNAVSKIKFSELDVDNEDITLSTIFIGDTSLALSLQFWRTGNHRFPSIKIQTFNEDSTLDVYTTEPIDFSVLGRMEVLESDLRAIKINKKLRLPLTITDLFLSLIIFISLIVGYILLNKKKKLASTLNPSQIIDILNDALIELDQLILPKLMDNNELEVFYISLSNILKKYLLQRFFFNATKMTTDEISNYLTSNNIPSAGLTNLLEEADLCKFAQKKYGVTTLLEAKKTAKTILVNLESVTI